MTSFKLRLEALINENSMENSSDTPDWVLSQFLCTCLDAFDTAVAQRDLWYDVRLEPGRVADEKWLHVAARIWQDQDMTSETMDGQLAQQIALMLQDKLG